MSPLCCMFYLLSLCIVPSMCTLLCYECNSMENSLCSDGNLVREDINHSFLKVCEGKNSNYVEEYKRPLCRKIEQKIKVRNNMRVIKRSCGYELHQNIDKDVCYKTRTEDHEEVVCQCFSPKCNNANIKHSNIYASFAYCLLVVFCYYQRFSSFISVS